MRVDDVAGIICWFPTAAEQRAGGGHAVVQADVVVGVASPGADHHAAGAYTRPLLSST